MAKATGIANASEMAKKDATVTGSAIAMMTVIEMATVTATGMVTGMTTTMATAMATVAGTVMETAIMRQWQH